MNRLGNLYRQVGGNGNTVVNNTYSTYKCCIIKPTKCGKIALLENDKHFAYKFHVTENGVVLEIKSVRDFCKKSKQCSTTVNKNKMYCDDYSKFFLLFQLQKRNNELVHNINQNYKMKTFARLVDNDGKFELIDKRDCTFNNNEISDVGQKSSTKFDTNNNMFKTQFYDALTTYVINNNINDNNITVNVSDMYNPNRTTKLHEYLALVNP